MRAAWLLAVALLAGCAAPTPTGVATPHAAPMAAPPAATEAFGADEPAAEPAGPMHFEAPGPAGRGAQVGAALAIQAGTIVDADAPEAFGAPCEDPVTGAPLPACAGAAARD